MGSKGRILAVDDSLEILGFYEDVLGEAGFEVYTATDVESAIDAAKRLRPQVILTDIIMPGMDGLELIDWLQDAIDPPPPIVVCSGFDAVEHEAMNRGAMLFLQKPVHSLDLVSCVELALRQSRVREEACRQASDHAAAKRRGWNDQRAELLARVDLADSALRETFAGLARWVAGYFGFGTALVNLVERDKLRVVASYGADAFPPGAVLERELTFCSQVLEGGSTLILADASLHPCFKTHPALTSGFRFHVGVPLTTGAGLTLGTLCLVDKQPRKLTADDTVILEQLGLQLARRLEGADAESGSGPFVFEVPPVLSRDMLRVVLGAEVRRAGRHGGAIELALIEHVAGQGGVARVCAAAILDGLERPRFAVAQYAPNVLAVVNAGRDPQALRVDVAAAIAAARDCTVLRGIGAVSYAVEGGTIAGEQALEEIADEALARASARGAGEIEHVVLRRDEHHAPSPPPG